VRPCERWSGPGMTTGSPQASSAVKSADRLMSLFEHLAEVGSAPFASIVRAMGLPNSSAYQLLQTACARGFVDFDETSRRYRLGIRIWQVAQAYSLDSDLIASAQPLMDDLVDRVGETVQLARLDGLENVYLAISESPHPMKLVSAVGKRLASHGTGLGKVLLSGLGDEELRRRLAGARLQRFTDRTITDPDVLVDRCRRIREQGFGEDAEEYAVGCRCLAMPIHGPGGATIAALSVSVPTPRYDEHVAKRIHHELGRTVAILEQTLRCSP
jgi:DNA-binding IclR family transcriptional regulator